MLTVNCGTGSSRRVALQIGSLSAFALPRLLCSQSLASSPSPRCKAVILVWLDGGASHLETYDPKPTAPAEYRGPLAAIQTNVPGVQFGEVFPRQARLMDKVSIVRTVTHRSGDHFYCAHWVLTGFESRSNGLDIPKRYPGAGAVVARTQGGKRPGLPPYVAIPYASAFGHRPGYHGAAYLGRQFDPLETVQEPHLPGFRVPNLSLSPELDLKRLDDRRGLLAGLDRLQRRSLDGRVAESLGAFQDQAVEFLHNPVAARAFDLESEPAALRDRYGRHLYGQSALLARRLVEAGVTFSTLR